MHKRIILYSVFISFLAFACAEKKNEPTITEKPAPQAELIKVQDPESESESNLLGKRMFILCAACHNLKSGEEHKVGPNLQGIFGSKAASKAGFAYSESLKASGITWDENTMRSWIENPAEFVEGTNMAFIGLTDEDQQTALIAYLKEQTQ